SHYAATSSIYSLSLHDGSSDLDIQLGLDLADAGLVQQHDLLELHGGFDQLLLIVLGQAVHRKKISKIHCISSVNCGIILPLYYRSEEHTSELQSRFDIVCRLLL